MESNIDEKEENMNPENPTIDEPVIQKPADEESIDAEPISEEPNSTEPIHTEPANTETADVEPMVEETVSVEPVEEESIGTEPNVEEIVSVEPVNEESINTEPSVEEIVSVEPIAEEPSNTIEITPIATEPTQSPTILEKLTKNKALLVIIPVVIIAIIALLVTASSKQAAAKARTQYITDLNQVSQSMLLSGAEAESIGNLTKSVWYNTIFRKSDPETDKYTKATGYFASDFNQSLQTLFSDPIIKTKITTITDARDVVAFSMKKLQNPKEEFAACYSTIYEMQDAYMALTDCAISPSGNLQAYSSTLNASIDKFLTAYKRLQTQIPD